MDEDPYQVLNLSPDASLEEVKRAYFYIAQIYHPNKGGSEQQFLRFQNAYNQIVNRPSYGTVAPRSFQDLKRGADSMPDVQHAYTAKDFRSGNSFDNQKFNNKFNSSDGDGYTYNVNNLVTQADRNLVDYRREYDRITMEAEGVTPMFNGGFDPMTFNKVFQHMKDNHTSTDLQEYTEPAPSTSKEIVSCVNLDKKTPDAGYYADYGNAYNMHQNPNHYDQSFIDQCKQAPEITRDGKLSQHEMYNRMNTYKNTPLVYNKERLITDRNSYLQEVEGIESQKARRQLQDQRGLIQDNSMDQFQRLMALRAPAGSISDSFENHSSRNTENTMNLGNAGNYTNMNYGGEVKKKHRKHKSSLASEIKDIKKLVKEQQKLITQYMRK